MHNHNSIKLTVQYLTERYPERQGFTCREIYETQPEVRKYLRTKNDVHSLIRAVLDKHQIPKEEQDNLIMEYDIYYSLYPLPLEWSNTAKKEIEETLKSIPMIWLPDCSISYTAQRLRQFTKRGKWLFRYKENKLWYYHL